MPPIRKIFFLTAFTLALSLQLSGENGYSANDPKPSEQKEFFANGKVKSVTVVKISTPRHIDLFNFYKKTKVERTEFDSITGNCISHTVRITKVGIGGKHCHELYYKRADFDRNGKRTRFEKSSCDRNKRKYIDYVNGKRTFVHIEKRRKRK